MDCKTILLKFNNNNNYKKISIYSKDGFVRDCENPLKSPWNLRWLVAIGPGVVSSPTINVAELSWLIIIISNNDDDYCKNLLLINLVYCFIADCVQLWRGTMLPLFISQSSSTRVSWKLLWFWSPGTRYVKDHQDQQLMHWLRDAISVCIEQDTKILLVVIAPC